jgi:CheY-like chemotaxis protein
VIDHEGRHALQGGKMPKILIVADRADAFDELHAMLADQRSVAVLWAHDAASALEKASAEAPDLVVVDEFIGNLTGLDWIRRLLKVNAFIQTAAVSRLPHEAFHEASEGLGVMAQLPPRPGEAEGVKLLQILNQLPA